MDKKLDKKRRVSKMVEKFESIKEIMKRQDIPDLFSGVNIEKEVQKVGNISIFSILKKWIGLKNPSIITNQDCTDVISGKTDYNDSKLRTELLLGSKLALMAYALPGFYPEISTNLYLKNSSFMTHFSGHVSQYARIATNAMDDILEGKSKFITLPDDNKLAGFYVRTPIRIWNKKGKKQMKIPSWDKRQDLINYFVLGNTNVYVLRKKITLHKYELYVLFRGTSNEFNGIPQYGQHYKNTQLFRYPQYDPIEEKFYPKGSNTKPLFYFYYMEMVKDVQEHIYKLLDILGVDDNMCERVVVSGHSMGGALTICFAHLCKLNQPNIWNKCQFRSYGAPFCCNSAAITQLEGWLKESFEPYKFVEVVNTDDFTNIQYKMGGQEAMTSSVQNGVSNLITWLVDTRFKKVVSRDSNLLFQRALRITQLYPETALTVFLSGALQDQSQIQSTDKKLAHRIGTSAKMLKLWGQDVLSQSFNRSLNVVFCKRRVRWENEYLGKSHTQYIDVNMKIFWSLLKSYEMDVYKDYHRKGLKPNINKLRIVGMFNYLDQTQVESIIDNYDVPVYDPSLKIIRNIAIK